MARFSRIVGTGMAVPERVLTNQDLERMMDTTDEWIRTRTGMRQRHVADEQTAVSDLAVAAARPALQAAGVEPDQVGLIIVATVSPDMLFPSAACFVQRQLGIRGCPAFDVSAACSGFVYALACADSMIQSGLAPNALVIGADMLTRYVDWQDRNSAVLFGDGAGAVVLAAGDRPGILKADLGAAGEFSDLLNVPGSGTRTFAGSLAESNGHKSGTIHLDGRSVYKHAVRVMTRSLASACAGAGIEPSQLDIVVPHQANIRIIQDVGQRLGLRPDQLVINVDRYANTSAATIPIALDEAVRDGRIKEDQLVGLVSFGGGLTWASAILRW